MKFVLMILMLVLSGTMFFIANDMKHGGTIGAKLLAGSGVTGCQKLEAPPILTLNFNNKQPRATHNFDHTQLGKFVSSTQFSHRPDEVFVTGGITESNITDNLRMDYREAINPITGTMCVSVSNIQVDIDYAPIVHIAVNFPEGSCQYGQTWQHELRHVNTDIIALNESMETIRATLVSAATRLPVIGPIPGAEEQKAQQELAAPIADVLKGAFDAMDKIRMTRQQAIDTREEYLRISRACPPLPAPVAASQPVTPAVAPQMAQ